MRELMGFLFRISPGKILIAITASVISGLLNPALIVVINESVAKLGQDRTHLKWTFIGACALLPIVRAFSHLVLVGLAQKAVFDLRIRLARQILASPLRKLEEMGPNKLLACLTTDVNTISTSLPAVPFLFMQSAIVIGSLSYLFYLYLPGGLGLVLATFGGFGLYMWFALKAQSRFAEVRNLQNDLFRHFEALTKGAKELKLHRERRQSFLSGTFHFTATSFRRQVMRGHTFFAAGSTMGHVLFFAAIGVCLFWLPEIDSAVTIKVLTGFVFVLLFLFVPLEALTNLGPVLGNAIISLGRVKELSGSLQSIGFEKENGRSMPADWRLLEYKGVTHTYWVEGEERNFTLGPIDLAFKPGELVFFTGGNGSGKTTLAKLMLGLYVPEKGSILLDGEEISDETRDWFRQKFTAVFSDFFLFESLLGLKAENLAEDVRAYLAKLQLTEKVTVEDGVLSTVDLSQGQRKRLALLTAFLEDRPIFLFDEWAADQEPRFKEIFYHAILPELRERGKTVFVITHDDHFYHAADRLIKLDYGKVEDDRLQNGISERA